MSRSQDPFRPARSMVTGASSGIGAEFARALAARGSDLVLVARREDRSTALAAELERAHGIHCRTVSHDLSEPAAGRRLRTLVPERLDLVVNNAGFAVQGPFVDNDADDLARLLAVDVAAVVDICSAFLPDMISRGTGSVVNVASTTAFQPVPTLAVYAAAKAFVLSFTQSLWYESRRHGVRVFALAPGPTRTEFFDVIGESAATTGSYQSPAEVVATAMRALDARISRPQVISGRRNAIAAATAALTPPRVLLPAVARLLR
ncbi:SDR family oxidoreductase [Rhodococcus sp. BP-241]|uniref:SDR family NAD(P)-dependent oxidoreductase n=1 Tax=unclassified Rhodococcus (in: high G+C Gram-positive bacteria) TaxID=192944 RepID=UPI001C9B6153|nr:MULTISPECIES: SDR family oxidoreductase [unclassified Rhodococcus (in: high G+C Gram-positive bacteria)]MBY6678924.1 SDR family oxidoreductase [Rhodococcus sp. BP-332]MBY6709384.1 SDR family oxidoreductase [Rhodococcus sp. BP-241]